MGSSHAREHGPLNVVVECASIVQEALPYAGDMATGKAPTMQSILCDRIKRQQAMISGRYKTDIWFCLYYCLLKATERHIAAKDVSRDDIQNMFGVFQDTSEEQRAPFDLATQILMIVDHLLSLSRATSMQMHERWQFHDSIADSIQSAEKRFHFLRAGVQKSHRPALGMLFNILSGIYRRPPRQDDQANIQPAEPAPSESRTSKTTTRQETTTPRKRRVTRSYSGTIVTPSEWSEE